MPSPCRFMPLLALALLVGCSASAPEKPPGAPGGPGAAAAEKGDKDKNQGPPPVGVVVQPAVLLKDSQEVELFGSVRSPDRLQVHSRTSGQVMRLSVREGDRVQAGQVIAQLDGEDQRLAVQMAQQAVEEQTARIRRMSLGQRKDQLDQILARRKAQEANLKLAQDDIARLEPLVIKGYAPQQDLISAELARDRVLAQLDELDAQLAGANLGEREEDIATQQVQLKIRKTELERAQLNLARTHIRAPVSGVVQSRTATLGQLVSTGDTLVDLVPTQGLDLELLLPETFTGRVKLGEHLQVNFPALGRQLMQGTVAGMSPATEDRSRNQNIRVKLVGALPQGLMPGMEARGLLRLGTAMQGIAVSRDALVMVGGKSSVFVVKEDHAEARPVQVKLDLGAQLLLQGDLEATEQVVILGNEQLKPGSPVIVAREAAPARLTAPAKRDEEKL